MLQLSHQTPYKIHMVLYYYVLRKIKHSETLQSWRITIKEKINNLEDLYNMKRKNKTYSYANQKKTWTRFSPWIIIVLIQGNSTRQASCWYLLACRNWLSTSSVVLVSPEVLSTTLPHPLLLSPLPVVSNLNYFFWLDRSFKSLFYIYKEVYWGVRDVLA